MIVIFVLGIEGTGHHLVDNYLRMAGLHTYRYTPKLTYETDFDFESRYLKFANSHPYLIHTQDSFPGNRPSHTENHPAIDTIKKLPFDLRLLKLYRNPVDAVCSAHRRFSNSAKKTEIVHLATVARDSIAILNSYKANYTLIYEKAARNQSYTIDVLKQLTIGLPANFDFVMPTHKATNYTCPHRTWLEKTFNYSPGQLDQ